jgi:POLQ-like helicase
MEKHGFLAGPISRERLCVFAQYYQFFRIVLFALEYGKPCVLLSDARSPTFANRGKDGDQPRRGLLPMLLGFVPETVRPQVKAVTVQEVVTAIKRSGRHPWISKFERKYGLV